MGRDDSLGLSKRLRRAAVHDRLAPCQGTQSTANRAGVGSSAPCPISDRRESVRPARRVQPCAHALDVRPAAGPRLVSGQPRVRAAATRRNAAAQSGPRQICLFGRAAGVSCPRSRETAQVERVYGVQTCAEDRGHTCQDELLEVGICPKLVYKFRTRGNPPIVRKMYTDFGHYR